VNSISTSILFKVIETYTNKDIEEVQSPSAPKQVNDDAIHLFPRQMYYSGSLNITGNTELDSTASPRQTSPLPQPTSPPIPASQSNTSDSPQESSSSPSPETEDQSDHNFSVEFNSDVGPNNQPTPIIEEHQIFDFIDDDDISICSTDSQEDEVILSSPLAPLTSLLEQTLTQPTPRVPPSDRVSSMEPKNKIVTTEYMQKCFGFRNITPILKTLKDQSQDTVTVRDTGNHPILSRGETATLSKAKSNSNPVQKPAEYGQVWHYDIVYGNGRAIGGIQYGLFFVDWKSRKMKIFSLKSLKKSHISSAMKKFVREVGFYPDEIIVDRDFKLIGSHIDDIMEPFTQVSGAPGGRQSQNGLSESNW
jgi:hypothetical protein